MKIISMFSLAPVVFLAGCAANYPLSLESMQAAFMEKAMAECEYETRGEPAEVYDMCMKAKGAK